MSTVDQIIAFESGELSNEETLQLFSELVKSGTVWKLQGTYGRLAANLIKSGYLTPEGDITDLGLELVDGE